MKRELTYEDAVLGLKRAIELKGADYVYERVKVSTGDVTVPLCVNWDNGQPSCIVGHVLVNEMGVDPDDPAAQASQAQSAAGTLVFLDIKADERTQSLLGLAQIAQDRGTPWGEAVESAIETVNEVFG